MFIGKVFRCLFLLCICASCGPTPRPHSIDPVFFSKYQRFLSYAVDHHVILETEKVDNLSIHFNEIHYGDGTEWIVGLCTQRIYTYGPPELSIDVDIKFWSDADDLTREALIFHELGHCLLNREHNNDTLNGVPVSLMHHSVVKSKDFGVSYDAYIDELFSLERQYR